MDGAEVVSVVFIIVISCLITGTFTTEIVASNYKEKAIIAGCAEDAKDFQWMVK